MYCFLSSTLRDQRTETLQGLTANHYLAPGEEDDPMYTMFTVTNGGSYEISKKHGIVCLVNLATGTNGLIVTGMLSWNTIDGKRQVSGDGNVNIHALNIPPSTSTLLPGGDAETDQCLDAWYFGKTKCADVTLIFWYSLESQPNVQEEKRFRFAVHQSKTGQFSWYPEQVSSPETYCDSGAIKPPPAPSP
jgi:hypothetical protein